MYKCVLILVGMFLSANVSFANTEKTSRVTFVQDQFVIGLWVAPPADENADQRYKELAEADFNVSVTRPSPIVAKACQKYGLKAIYQTHKDSDVLLTGPEVMGYAIKDEPSVNEFAEVKRRLDKKHRDFPGKLCYVNLFPGYASPKKHFEAPSYEIYVSRFMEEVQPEVLSMDHYPRIWPGSAKAGKPTDKRHEYTRDLAMMRKYSLKAGIPFWNYFNAMAYGTRSDPTETQIRWQIYSSLVYGAKGVLYFCYYTPRSKSFKLPAIIDLRGNKTHHYDHAKRINAELKNLGPVLMKLTSTDVRNIKGETSSKTDLSGTPLKTIQNAQTPNSPYDLLLGTFSHSDGRRAIMIQNNYLLHRSWMTIEFDLPVEQVVEVCKKTGKEISIYDSSLRLEGTQISLAPGEGRLFLVGTKK